MVWSEIHPIPGLNTKENYLCDDEDYGEGPNGERIRPVDAEHEPNNDGKTLLHLLFWLAHTRAGRKFVRVDLALNPDGTLSAEKRQLLNAELTRRGVTDERIQSAIAESHVAAVNWERAHNAVDSPSRPADLERWGKIYLQQTAFITWCLWEDAKGHEFSMIW